MEHSAHVDRANQAFKAFVALRKLKLREDAFSRGFYALLHLSFALLIKHGRPLPKTYAGLVGTLWSLREDLGLSTKLVQSLSRMQALREGGDYEAVPLIQESDLDNVVQTFDELSSLVERRR